MKCIRVGYGNVFKLHEDKLAKCGVETAGVIDNNPEKVKQAKENDYAAFETVKEAMKLKHDFWDVCSPNDTHVSVLKDILSLDPKAKVIVEKPVCEYNQIEELEQILTAHSEAMITVNENYLASAITKQMKDVITALNLKPERVVAEMSKHRGKDFAAGRYCDKTLFALGYEGPHMLTIVSGLGEEYLPQDIKEASLSDAVIKMEDGSTKTFEKQGTARAVYKSKAGIDVVLHTSMIGEVGFPYPPHAEENMPQEDPKTRYRILAAEGKTTVVGFYEPIRDFERSKGSVSIIVNGIAYVNEPVADDTMGNQLKFAVEYFQGKRDTPCKPEVAIDIVRTLNRIIAKAK